MKKIATKLITISGQVLLVSLFLVVLFSSEVNNKKTVKISNDNFIKMADSVSYLFKQEEEEKEKDIDETIVTPLDDEENNSESLETKKKEEEEKPVDSTPVSTPDVTIPPQESVLTDYVVLDTVVGNLTGYGPDCYGCTGKTSTGHNLYESIYYNDSEYGSLRILAADSSFPDYSVFRVTIPGKDSFLAIVLDRGGNVGYGKGTLFDLAYATESDPDIIGLTYNVTFELLRSGR